MAYRNLDEFIIRLEQENEHITSSTTNGFLVVQDIFASAKRIAWALNVENLDILSQQVGEFILPGTSLSSLMSRAGSLMSAIRQVNGVKSPPVQAVCLPPDLSVLPHIYQAKQDSHPTIPFVQIVTQDGYNHGGCVAIYDSNTLGVSLNHHEPIPAAIVIGSDPAIMWSTHAPLPAQFDPYWLAGWLRHKSVHLTQGISQPVSYPADAEIVIEGIIHPQETLPPAYLGDSDGFYRTIQHFKRMEVTSITHRENAIFPLITVDDTYWINKAVERLFLPILKLLLEEVIDIHIPQCGAGRNLIIISIKKQRTGDAYKVLHGIWGIGELAYHRAVVVVDEDVNIYDLHAVKDAVFQRVNWQEDVIISRGITHPQDLINPHGIGAKIGIDATRKLGSPSRIWDNAVRFTHDPADAMHHPDDHIMILNPQVDLTQKDLVWRYILAGVDWQQDFQINRNRVIIDATRKLEWTSQ